MIKNSNDIISSSKEILGGTHVFKGTRVPVKAFFEYLKAGKTLDEFLEDFPSISREQAISLLNLIEQEFNNAEPFSSQELSSITSSLVGILKNTGIQEEDYKQYLEDKHL